MEYVHSRLLDADGNQVWEGPYDEREQAPPQLELGSHEGADALAALCGARWRSGRRPWVAHGELFGLSRELGMISTTGTARGFVVLPPPGALLERCVAAFNQHHLHDLVATEIMLPTVFDHEPAPMRELTASYAEDGRLFRLDEPAGDLRLTYAADPHLFNWLRGRELVESCLPYTVLAEIAVLRRHRSGEIGRLNRVREYRLPDVHSFVAAAGAEAQCLRMTTLAADAIRFWADEAWVQLIDVTADFTHAHPQLASEMAIAARRPTMVSTFANRPRYYEMRSGLIPDAGTGGLMLYNLQWDEQNPRRFDIRLDSGEPLVILHGNLAAGSGILSLVLGRALAGLAPAVVPVELAATQVVLQPIAEHHRAAADAHSARLEALGIRTHVSDSGRPLGRAMRQHARAWRPFVAVIGDRETDGTLYLQRPGTTERLDEKRFFARYGERLRRCRPAVASRVAPFPFSVQDQ